MLLINKSRKINLASEVKICSSLFSRAKGLMFSKKNEDKALVFIFSREARPEFHMLFVFFPIDMLFLDSKKKVVEIKHDIKPFTLSIKPLNKIKYVIELPAGVLIKSGTQLGDIIFF